MDSSVYVCTNCIAHCRNLIVEITYPQGHKVSGAMIGRQGDRHCMCLQPSTGPCTCNITVSIPLDEQWRDHTLSLALHKTMVYISFAQTLNGPHFRLTTTCNELKLNLLYSLNVLKYATCFGLYTFCISHMLTCICLMSFTMVIIVLS